MGGQQCFVWGRRTVRHTKIGVKGRKMNRHLIPHATQDPVTHPADLVRRIICIRNDEIRDFEPHIAVMLQPPKRLQHGLQMRVGNTMVEFFSKCLQIDVGRVHVFKERSTGLRLDVPRSDRHRLDARVAAGLGAIDGIFGPNHRVVVRIGHTATSQPLCGQRDRLWGRLFAQPLDFA